MPESIQKIKGVADLFGDESSLFTFIEQTARDIFSCYSYEEVRIPLMEKTPLFARSIGAQTDVVQKEMYTFADRKGRSLTLRPEATAGLMRAFIENKCYAKQQATRLFTFGPMFRYERPQKGRLRQFHQLDVELIGPEEPAADAEILLMLLHYLDTLGLEELCLELNTLGCKQCRPSYIQALTDFFAPLAAQDLCQDCQKRRHSNPLRLLDCKVPACNQQTAQAPSLHEFLCKPCQTAYTELRGILDTAQVNYRENPRLVRGLDYYVGTTFEVTSGAIGAQTAVAGGGRYDGLIQELGGPDIAGIGFALGMERLALLLGKQTLPAPDFYIALMDPEAAHTALLLAQELREAGLSGQTDFTAGSLKSRLRMADKTGTRFCLLLGSDEQAARTVTIKNMRTGKQTCVAQQEVTRYIQTIPQEQ